MLKFFAEKNSEYCILNPLKQLTKWLLTSSLSNDALNNWAQGVLHTNQELWVVKNAENGFFAAISQNLMSIFSSERAILRKWVPKP